MGLEAKRLRNAKLAMLTAYHTKQHLTISSIPLSPNFEKASDKKEPAILGAFGYEKASLQSIIDVFFLATTCRCKKKTFFVDCKAFVQRKNDAV